MKKVESDLIQELFRSVEVLGVDATTTALKNARGNTLTLQDKRIDFVLRMCATHFMQSIEDIIYSHSKSNKRMMALKFSVFYLYKIFDLSFTDLHLIFKRDKSLLSRSVKEVKELAEKDESVLSIKHKFDILIADFRIKNNL